MTSWKFALISTNQEKRLPTHATKDYFPYYEKSFYLKKKKDHNLTEKWTKNMSIVHRKESSKWLLNMWTCAFCLLQYGQCRSEAMSIYMHVDAENVIKLCLLLRGHYNLKEMSFPPTSWEEIKHLIAQCVGTGGRREVAACWWRWCCWSSDVVFLLV